MLLFREELALSEWAMRQRQWTVSRRQVGHPAAQRRWDRAYQLLLQTTGAPRGLTGTPASLEGASEESRHASSRLCSGLDPASGPGADD
jgi:hypothetical protein